MAYRQGTKFVLGVRCRKGTGINHVTHVIYGKALDPDNVTGVRNVAGR